MKDKIKKLPNCCLSGRAELQVAVTDHHFNCSTAGFSDKQYKSWF